MNRAQSAASRKDRILQSPQFRQGRFHNISVTPVQTKEFSVLKLLRDQFNPPPDKNPVQALPMVRTDVNRNEAEPMIVWFGHSSYFIRLHDVSILVDPVFSGRVSPVSFFGKSLRPS
ncbi:MAG: hypothetical protein MUE95_08225 [Cyclobacteriaceae bacterium]|nr:hypothetical protein [Cyclobacteriaceae bacterium]